MISAAIVRRLEGVDPEKRRVWASRVLVLSLIGWWGSHLGLILLPSWFFAHVLLAISWLAISITAVDVLSTTDVRANEE